MTVSDKTFSVERYLTVEPPDYEKEGLVAELALAATLGLWMLASLIALSWIFFQRSFVSFFFSGKESALRGNHQVGKSGSTSNDRMSWLSTLIKGSIGFFVLCLIVVFRLNPYNTFALRRVFQVPIFTTEECTYLTETMLPQCAKRNALLFNQSKPELLEHPLGWFKRRDPIYPTTDLHPLLEPFSNADRLWLKNRLERRLAPVVSRIYGVPLSALRVNDMFFVRYDHVDGTTKKELKPHTDTADISFNILLNNDFMGGGTRFWIRDNFGQQENDKTIDEAQQQHLNAEPFAHGQPSVGDALLHGSQILHEGYPISSGVRIILVGFFAVDRVDPVPGTNSHKRQFTGLSWAASWLSLSWLYVKVKDSYIFADRRRESASVHWNWRDRSWLLTFRHVLTNLLKILGDELGTHEMISMVHQRHRQEYLMALDNEGDVEAKVNWFRGQHLDVTMAGAIEREWVSRVNDPDKFALEL